MSPLQHTRLSMGHVHTTLTKCTPALGPKVPSLPLEETRANIQLICFAISRRCRTDLAEVNRAFQTTRGEVPKQSSKQRLQSRGFAFFRLDVMKLW